MELGAHKIRHALDAHKNPETGHVPVVVLRLALTSEWSSWVVKEDAREARLHAQHKARLAACGHSDVTFEQARQQVLAYKGFAEEGAAALEALAARKDAGEDVDAEIERTRAEVDESATAWKEALKVFADYEGADVPSVVETLDTLRHSFDLVLSCITSIEGVTAGGGKPLVWSDTWLSEAGHTKAGVLEQLLGPGEGALVELYNMVRLVVRGLEHHQKKA